MEKKDPKRPFSFVFDEQGANEVSQQIMDSYKSGFMGEETTLANSQKKVETGTEMLGTKIF